VFYSGDECRNKATHWAPSKLFSEALVEAYADGEMEERIQVWARNGPGDANGYLVMYRRIGEKNRTRDAVLWFVSKPCSAGSIYSLKCEEYVTMLINVVKIAELGQSAPYVGSLVWLYNFDDLIGRSACIGKKKGSFAPPLPSLPWRMMSNRKA
jgi:hypothetical protein